LDIWEKNIGASKILGENNNVGALEILALILYSKESRKSTIFKDKSPS